MRRLNEIGLGCVMLAVAWGAPCAMAQAKWSATFVRTQKVGQEIIVDFGGPLAYDRSANTVTLADASATIDLKKTGILSLQGFPPQLFQATACPSPSPVPGLWLTLTLSHFVDAAGSPVSLDDFQTGTRQYFIVLKSAKDNRSFVIPFTVKGRGVVTLNAKTDPLKRDVITLWVVNADVTALSQRLSQDLKSIVIVYDFGPTSTVSNIRTHATKIQQSGSFAIDIFPATPLPFHSGEYNAIVQIPKADLPAGIEVPKPAAPYPVSAAADYPSPTVTKTNAVYNFEPTLTSSVSNSTHRRTTSGLFALTLNPVLFLHEEDVDGEKRAISYWWDFRPNISANVDTLPEKSSASPNRISVALDSELGLSRKRASGSGFDDLTWTNGARTDSDRDFKLFSTYWHTDLSPDFWKWSESQAYRTGQYVPAGRAPLGPRRPVVTAYRFRPSFGYEIGATTVRSGILDPTLGSFVSRVLLKFDAMLELWRNVTFSAVDTSYYLLNAPRRNARGFLDTEVAVNTGLILRMNRERIQSAVIFKYQRGEESPTFISTDTVSLGLKIYK